MTNEEIKMYNRVSKLERRYNGLLLANLISWGIIGFTVWVFFV